MSSKKQKPLLHRVKGSEDVELYSQDLDWYFTCYDFIAGLGACDLESLLNEKSNEGNSKKAIPPPEDAGLEANPKSMRAHVMSPEVTWPYTDWHVKAFTRARRIWHRFSRMRWSEQEGLRRYYTPRQYYDEFTPQDSEHYIRALHRSYYGAGQ